MAVVVYEDSIMLGLLSRGSTQFTNILESGVLYARAMCPE